MHLRGNLLFCLFQAVLPIHVRVFLSLLKDSHTQICYILKEQYKLQHFIFKTVFSFILSIKYKYKGNQNNSFSTWLLTSINKQEWEEEEECTVCARKIEMASSPTVISWLIHFYFISAFGWESHKSVCICQFLCKQFCAAFLSAPFPCSKCDSSLQIKFPHTLCRK